MDIENLDFIDKESNNMSKLPINSLIFLYWLINQNKTTTSQLEQTRLL